MSLPEVRLDSVAEVRLGRQRSPKNHSGSQMRLYLRAANVGWDGLLLDDVMSMNFTDAEMATYRLRAGDILLSEASGSPGEVGKPALWSDELPECAFQNTLLRVRPRQHEPAFLLHYFRWMALSGRFMPESRGVGINHLGRTRLAAWSVPMIPIGEQRRIVEIIEDHLSRLDAGTAGLRTAQVRTRRLLRSTLWAATHGLPGATLHPLSDIAEVRLGRQRSPKNHSGDRMLPYLRAANVDWDRLRLDDVKEMHFTEAEEAIYGLRAGDILLTEASGSPAEVGKSVVYRGTPDRVCFQNTLLRVRPYRDNPDFIQKYLLAEALRGRFMPESRGVSINHLGRARLAAMPVEIPSAEAQAEAVAASTRVQEALHQLEASLTAGAARSASLRRAVLATAFSGRLTGAASDGDLIEETAETLEGER